MHPKNQRKTTMIERRYRLGRFEDEQVLHPFVISAVRVR